MQRASRARSIWVAGVVAGILGCGGSSSGTGKSLDCAYLAGDNCWKTTASAAASCLPDSSAIGALSADGKTCTYASGEVITFTQPLVLPLADDGSIAWNFTVTAASGATCLTYKDDGNGTITLATQGDTFREMSSGGLSLTLTCPDDTTYSTANAFNLLSCPDGGLLNGLPGTAYSDTDTSVSLSLISTGTGSYGSEPVFNCQLSPS